MFAPTITQWRDRRNRLVGRAEEENGLPIGLPCLGPARVATLPERAGADRFELSPARRGTSPRRALAPSLSRERRRTPLTATERQAAQTRARAHVGDGRRELEARERARRESRPIAARQPRVQGRGIPRSGAGRAPGSPRVTMADLADRQFRGYRDVDVNRLRDTLPPSARHLARTFVEAGRRYNLDPLALAAIARHETGNFTSSAFRNKNNAMGVSGAGGPRRMASHEQSIEYMARRIASPTGLYRNARNLRDLWYVYAPPSTRNGGRPVANDPRDLNRLWGGAVERYIRAYERAVGV